MPESMEGLMPNSKSEPELPLPLAQQGGIARAAKLAAPERRRIAAEASVARWHAGAIILKATHGSPDRPLRIGDLEIPCYVLEGGTRVLAMTGMLKSLNMSLGGEGRGAKNRLARFVETRGVGKYATEELRNKILSPVLFRVAGGSGITGGIAYGYEATILADLCDAVLAARTADDLAPQQRHIAIRCEVLMRGFARTGIIGLVDEATGYQEVRDRRALEEILNKYLAEELRKYTTTFPDAYFREVFRLKKWNVPLSRRARPGAFAGVTNNIVYERLAPGLLDELQSRNPTDGHGKRKHKHFQFLSDDFGDPRLREHLDRLVFLMQACTSWPEFVRLLDRAAPRVNGVPELDFEGNAAA
jgi:hypothetical protein